LLPNRRAHLATLTLCLYRKFLIIAASRRLRRHLHPGQPRQKAVACLTKDREALLAFFDFPAEHWDHLRTSNPIESVFATVRHRTVRTKGALSTKTAKLMVFKLVNAAAKTWRRLKGENQLPKVVQGVKFKNGVEVTEMPAHHAA
jgi:putative transposase